jgi:hypothetical protein
MSRRLLQIPILITDHLYNAYDQLPPENEATPDEIQKLWPYFGHVIGAMDGSHIELLSLSG